MSSPIPTEFSNVTAVCKANVFFDGKVVSHTLRFSDGAKKTLGLIYPGEYHFGTGAPEKMEIIAGNCRVKLDGGDAWKTCAAGTFFRVPGNSGFSIAVDSDITEYVCSFESATN
jgi:purine/pyrimidine-nucleoside phosphorylase